LEGPSGFAVEMSIMPRLLPCLSRSETNHRLDGYQKWRINHAELFSKYLDCTPSYLYPVYSWHVNLAGQLCDFDQVVGFKYEVGLETTSRFKGVR
jgi:hypothetical protein